MDCMALGQEKRPVPNISYSDQAPLVLVVDDNEAFREGYSAYLQFVGLDVVTAENGNQAVEKARRLLPDVIVMDLSMPELDGSLAAAALKEGASTKDIPVIAVSGHPRPPAAFRALAAGCDVFLQKPLVPRDLNHTIWALAGRRRAGALAR
jgi:two-component system cell cycle response regulator DivK